MVEPEGAWDDEGGEWYDDGDNENSSMTPANIDYAPINEKGFRCVNGSEVNKQLVAKMEEL